MAILLGKTITVKLDPKKIRPIEREHLAADTTRLKELLGWVPSAALRAGLTKLLRKEGLLR